MHAPALIVEDGVSSLSGSDATQPSGYETETLDDGVSSQRRVINLSYTISLLFFGFLSPLAALCWLYLRMYEAALKNSARTGTRRQSLCSNAAAETGALTLATDPLNHNDAIQMNKIHQPSLAEALTAAATAAAIAAASSDPQSTPIRISRLPHDQSRYLRFASIFQPEENLTLVGPHPIRESGRTRNPLGILNEAESDLISMATNFCRNPTQPNINGKNIKKKLIGKHQDRSIDTADGFLFWQTSPGSRLAGRCSNNLSDFCVAYVDRFWCSFH